TYTHEVNNKFCIVVGVASTLRPQVVTDFNVEIFASMNLEHLQSRKLFPNVKMYDKFGCETGRVLPLYFDHKIANEFGSYQFYHQIIAHPISRSCINKITQSDVDSIISKLNK